MTDSRAAYDAWLRDRTARSPYWRTNRWPERPSPSFVLDGAPVHCDLSQFDVPLLEQIPMLGSLESGDDPFRSDRILTTSERIGLQWAQRDALAAIDA